MARKPDHSELNLDPKSWGHGVWFYAFCRAIRARSNAAIDKFIRSDIPILTNLLCIVCSKEARTLISTRHPSQYLEIYDVRGENIGMYLWIFDLHNDVNRGLEKPICSRDESDLIYAPLLTLSTIQIEEDYGNAQTSARMRKIWEVSYPGSRSGGLEHDPKSWGPGVWFYAFSRALRSRSAELITDFIGYDVPILLGLLCGTCSQEAYDLCLVRHPSGYRKKRNSRDELIGLYLWLSDLHNDINKRLKKPYYPQPVIDSFYSPLLELNKGQIDSDEIAAESEDTIENIFQVVFSSNLELELMKATLQPTRAIIKKNR